MKLYYVPGVCSLASHIALRESGLPFTLDKMDRETRVTESGEHYLAANPKGSVPALRLDNGDVLTEGAVILQYIADQAPTTGLAPAAGGMARYRLMEWLNYIATEVHKQFSPLFNPKLPPEWRENQLNVLAKRFDYLTERLGKQPYLMGERFTIADAYLFLFTVLRWSARLKVDLEPWPVLTAYMARVAARPATTAALQAEGLAS
jgi:glutathione S-transferase